MDSNRERQLKFVPPKSFVHRSFWYKLADTKLNIDMLQDTPKEVHGVMNCSKYSRLLVEVDCTSFNSQSSTSSANSNWKGILLNTNTYEEFKSKDKKQLIKRLSDEYFNQLLSKDKLTSSSEVFFFLLFSFADCKAHKFYYWFAFPAFQDIIYKCASEFKSLSSIFSEPLLEKFELQLHAFRDKCSEPVFIFNSKLDILKLSDLIHHNKKDENFKDIDLTSTYICCDDRSLDQNPSWSLRQLLGYLVFTCPQLANKEIKCICLRQPLQASIVLLILMPSTETSIKHIVWTGWEASKNGKQEPQFADMSKVMDPEILAEKSISLNLTLMKWRLLPNLNIKIINQTKYLLLGAGTLGCGVARSLLAWGAQHITFVDCGKVSLSNPVRQSLYLYEDALDGGKPKALTAARRLKQINPCVTSNGYCLKIPMPGHSVGESQRTETIKALENLEDLIKEHDVIFLLTDSRESRWLPTMLAAYHGKMTINAALGFDSFLVMRHGAQSTTYSERSVQIEGFKEVPGSCLGCYFCNDVVAPGDSLKDRTLDQQCTVTRPAVASIASSLAVELAVSLLQHDLRDGAPAYYKTSSTTYDVSDIPEGILGIVPHSIRGNISSFTYLITATERFSECIACSKLILERFGHQGKSLVMEALNSAKVLEDISGISHLTSSIDEMSDFSGSDTE